MNQILHEKTRLNNFIIHPNEIWSFLSAIASNVIYWKKGCVVEIGSGKSVWDPTYDYFLRNTTSILCEIAEWNELKFYSCDNRKNISPDFGYDKHTHFTGTSDEFISQWDLEEKPSFVLLDDGHEYSVVKKQFSFFFDFLIEGGVIALHDTLPINEEYLIPTRCHDSYRFRQELERDKGEWNIDILTFPYGAYNCGLSFVLKREKTDLYFRRLGC
jgi:hypothetical protein